PPPDRVLSTADPARVPEILATVAEETARGRWASGYVGYEAAAGLDPGLAVRPPAPGDPPLIWFALTAAPTPGPAISRHFGHRTGDGGRADWRADWSADEHAAAVRR